MKYFEYVCTENKSISYMTMKRECVAHSNSRSAIREKGNTLSVHTQLILKPSFNYLTI